MKRNIRAPGGNGFSVYCRAWAVKSLPTPPLFKSNNDPLVFGRVTVHGGTRATQHFEAARLSARDVLWTACSEMISCGFGETARSGTGLRPSARFDSIRPAERHRRIWTVVSCYCRSHDRPTQGYEKHMAAGRDGGTRAEGPHCRRQSPYPPQAKHWHLTSSFLTIVRRPDHARTKKSRRPHPIPPATRKKLSSAFLCAPRSRYRHILHRDVRRNTKCGSHDAARLGFRPNPYPPIPTLTLANGP